MCLFICLCFVLYQATINRDIEVKGGQLNIVYSHMSYDHEPNISRSPFLSPMYGTQFASAFAISKNTQDMWETGEDFEPRTEEMFSYLQVLTACLLSFAHGEKMIGLCLVCICLSCM